MAGEFSNPHITSEFGKPLRVIDVAATISCGGGVCFKKPDTATDFHIISHTWSQEVRKFSEHIGQIVKAKQNSDYNDVFQKENFSENECYKDLKVFLEMLEYDGVEYVWYDAVCIDQTSDEEKGIEIARMANYYSNNKGCYVLTHGFGRGYSFWQTKAVERKLKLKQNNRRLSKSGGQHKCVLPRWFERAWTLQEYVLPTKLTFLVAFERKVVRFINRFMEFNKCEVGFCKCCLLHGRKIFTTFVKQYYQEYEKNVIIKEAPNLIDGRDKKCEKCGSFPLVRKAKKRDAKMMIHFVDRDAYTFLCRLLYEGRHDPIRWAAQNTVRLLESSLQSPMTVARHIADRDCSIDEDRILCILGLLGSNDVKPVRTNLSLEKQILTVCQNNNDLLIQLCAMSVKGNCFPGMSWAPWLKSHDDNNSLVRSATQVRLCPGRITKSDVEDVKVLAEGLELSANMAHNRVIGISGSRVSKVTNPDLIMRRQKSFGLIATSPYHPYQGYLHMPLSNYSDVNQVEFEMWWILLGDTQRLSRDCKLVMACVGKNKDNLHKIGLFWIPFELAPTIFLEPTTPKTTCCVRGFGNFLDKYVTPSSEKCAINDSRPLFPPRKKTKMQ